MSNCYVLPSFKGDINNKYTFEVNLTSENIYTGSFIDINLDTLDSTYDNYIPINMNSKKYLYVDGIIKDYNGVPAANHSFSIFKNYTNQDIIRIEKLCDFITDPSGCFTITLTDVIDFSTLIIKIK